jgi:DNA-binding MarR family transcriptional regulator
VTTAAAGPSVPPPESWPDPLPHTEAGQVFTELIIATFRLNGRLMDVAQDLASAGGVTAAWWQVLGGVLDEPRTVAEVGRRMGVTRQGVQRVANVLVERGLAEYRPNPSHQRAKLLSCTMAGYWAIRQIAVAQHPWANRVGGAVGVPELRGALNTLTRLVDVLEANPDGEEERTVPSVSPLDRRSAPT